MKYKDTYTTLYDSNRRLLYIQEMYEADLRLAEKVFYKYFGSQEKLLRHKEDLL